MKRQSGYTNVSYRELARNAAQVSMLMGLTILYLKRCELMAWQ